MIRETMRSIPIARPDISDAERELVALVLRGDSLALGPFVDEFERGIASIAGRRYAVACSSGTAALHLAVRGLGIGTRDEVITTPFSFVASANCIVYEGALPRMVDIEEDTLGLDPDQVEAAVSGSTRAILAVDVFGQPCRLNDLERLAARCGLHLIEDSCEALGSSLRGRPLGSFGAVAAFAFYPNKQITTGEGGALVTDDPELAALARSMRNQGRDEDGTWLRHVRLGFNYRMDELSAALGVAQLRRYRELRAKRAAVVAGYERALANLDWLHLPVPAAGADVDWFVYVIRLDPEIDRGRLIGQLDAAGIASRPYFTPLHLQPLYRQMLGTREGAFPVTERVAASTLALPFSTRLTNDDISRVAGTLVSAVAEQFQA